MKRTLFTAIFLFSAYFLIAQVRDTESEIRNLEQLEVQAVLNKDTVMLLKLWAKDYVVNAPDNMVNFAGRNTLDRPVLKRPRISFTRSVEHVIIQGDVVLAMGSETVVAPGAGSQTQQPVKRRYTNIWMKQEGTWKLIGRHANVICP
ncbi:YybH family protein [Parachryseolinea silvisoli]|uniref:YybH family protein n=1 Tax=Parachryseolinea silvisoli TaxID=2873601 RepID=UPI002265CFB3|nr:nuclear transport factor 2 family protein [Parachryseolinea silvisoli]MCD9018264.1 nuclear transport factor 2 family protein [Parachryseolinea silvisoli]